MSQEKLSLDEALDKLEQRHLYNVLTDSDTESSIAKIKDAYQAAFIAGAKFREAQLLEIVNQMKVALKRCSDRKIYFKDGGQARYSSGATTYFYKDEEWCESDFTDETLTSVNKALDEMRLK